MSEHAFSPITCEHNEYHLSRDIVAANGDVLGVIFVRGEKYDDRRWRDEEGEAFADLLTRAVNSHEELLAAAKEIFENRGAIYGGGTPIKNLRIAIAKAERGES